ncbi:MAG: methionyl-tRNA formyltransferase [Acidimicrobiales bacterium]|jgi:methionyl-tRNA formyltransferase|nr:methionyl-tRNA formyltransferase [Acidimicrobiales bacterium]
MKKLLIYANGLRAIGVFSRLLEENYQILGVVVPDSGGGQSQITDACDALSISCFTEPDVNSDRFQAEWSGKNRPDLGIICGYPTIFHESLIELPRCGTINLHAGPLPSYRGGSPLNWQLIHGQTKATVSVLWVTSGIDAGNILAEESFPIRPNDTIRDLHSAANRIFPELVTGVLEQLASGEVTGHKQDADDVCYWHQRGERDGEILWRTFTANDVHNLVRAITHPYPGAYTQLGNSTVRIWSTEVPKMMIRGTPGRICVLDSGGPYVICMDTAVRLLDYSIEGTKSTIKNGSTFTQKDGV